MNIKKICKTIAGPCMLLTLGICLGVVGTIENGGSLSLAWVAFAAIGVLGVILGVASDAGDK